MPTKLSDSELKAMRLAIDGSHHAAANGDGPFGATPASHGGEILLDTSNNTKSAADCTGHSEMVLVREAKKQFGLPDLRGATALPAASEMCAGAMFWAGIGRIVFGARRPTSFARWALARRCRSTAARPWPARSPKCRSTGRCWAMRRCGGDASG